MEKGFVRLHRLEWTRVVGLCKCTNQGDVVDVLSSTGLQVMNFDDGPDLGSDVCLCNR